MKGWRVLSKSSRATSAHEILCLFREALLSLIPIAEKAHMAWREPEAYDDWDRICEAIFQSIVVESIENAEGIGKFFPMQKYDQRIASYHDKSFIARYGAKEINAFICFETRDKPFDTCLFATLDVVGNVTGEARISISSTKMIFARRDENGLKFFDQLDIAL
jgi:hypothetical protein